MAHPEPLIIPDGVSITLDPEGAVIENDGDIILHSDLGTGFSRLVSHRGSITLTGDMKAGSLRAAKAIELRGEITAADISAGEAVVADGVLTAGDIRSDGDIRLAGRVEATSVIGRAIEIRGESFKARAVRGAHRIDIGPTRISVDILLSPHVGLDQSARGRVAVIEAHNDIGPNAIKGGFALEEFAEFSGTDPAKFLADRGIQALGAAEEHTAESQNHGEEPVPSGGLDGPEAIDSGGLEPEPEEEPVAPIDEPEDLQEGLMEEPGPEEDEIPPLPEVESAAVNPEDMTPLEDADLEDSEDDPRGEDEPPPLEEDPLPEEIEEPEPVSVEPEVVADVPPLDPLQEKLLNILTQIDKCYAEGGEPPAINDLRQMIMTARYEELRGQIANIWNDLLRFHQQNSMRVPHRVTNSFNNINSLVRNA